MKLKTLKDIEKNNAGLMGINCSNILKQEAIQWIKRLDKETKDLRPHNLDNYSEKIVGLAATIEWIMMFFNITGEDLK